MSTSTLGKLLLKMSDLGLETLNLLQGRRNQNLAETLCELCQTVLQLKGEAASVVLAGEILHHYQGASDADKVHFFSLLYERFGADPEQVQHAVATWQQAQDQSALQALAQACDSPRLELLRNLNTAPGGTLALIGMRADLQGLGGDDKACAVVAHDLLRLFRGWFNRGFLELRDIDWRTPALVLEKLIQYESVHAIQGWPDLRRRLERDRRCYGFFHPALPDEPLIFVEAALTVGISDNIAALLQQAAPDEDQPAPDTAVFYSINNCLAGLRGVSFGNFLIKQVIEHLAAAAPHITRYVTLSPVPGFLRWLGSNPAPLQQLPDLQRAAVESLLVAAPVPEALATSALLQESLPRLCAQYLVEAKSRERPADPVARFHLGNGARLERINWLADSSENGLQQSAGLMVNYIYDRKTLARNHEAYEELGEITCSAAIRKLLNQGTAK